MLPSGLAVWEPEGDNRVRLLVLPRPVESVMFRAMSYNRAFEELIKIFIASGGMILAFVWPWIRKEKIRTIILLVLTVAAFLNYSRLDMRRFQSVDSYDLLHYYLAARYFDEVGYFDLYPALLLVDHEAGAFDRRLTRYRAQDPDEGYQRRPLREGVERGREIRRTQFTRDRWRDFEADVLYLQRDVRMARSTWRTMMNDRGFNGTPAWLIVARPLASLVPARYVRLLCLLDIIWLLAALFLVRKAFSNETALWCLFFLLVTYSWRWTVPGRVFLRHDWISAVMIACSMIKMARPALGGAFVGYAALMRFFPAVWLFGVGTKVISQMIERRKFEIKRYMPQVRTVLGFLAMLVVLESAAAAIIGTEAIRQHTENISAHTSASELSSRRVGFAIGYGHQWRLTPRYITEERKDEIADAKTERLLLVFVVLCVLGWGLRRSPDYEAFAFGFIPFFLLATASYYYFSARVMLIILHAFDLTKWRNRVGLALLFGIEVFSNGAETLYQGHRVFLVGGLSQLLTVYVLLMVGWLVYDARREGDDKKSGDKKSDDKKPAPKGKRGKRGRSSKRDGNADEADETDEPDKTDKKSSDVEDEYDAGDDAEPDDSEEEPAPSPKKPAKGKSQGKRKKKKKKK